MSTLLRCCSCLPALPAESTLAESFSSRLALRAWALRELELERKPPVPRFLVLAAAALAVLVEEDVVKEDEPPPPPMAELSSLLVVLVLLLCSVELLLVLVVLLADTLA